MLSDGSRTIILRLCVIISFQQVYSAATPSAIRGYLNELYVDQKPFDGNESPPTNCQPCVVSNRMEDLTIDSLEVQQWCGTEDNIQQNEDGRLLDVASPAEDGQYYQPPAFLIIPINRNSKPSIQQPQYPDPDDYIPQVKLHPDPPKMETLPNTRRTTFQMDNWLELDDDNDSEPEYLRPMYRDLVALGGPAAQGSYDATRMKRELEESTEATKGSGPLFHLAPHLLENPNHSAQEHGVHKNVKEMVKPALDFLKKSLNRKYTSSSNPDQKKEELSSSDNTAAWSPLEDTPTILPPPEGFGKHWNVPFSVLDIGGVIDSNKDIKFEEEEEVQYSYGESEDAFDVNSIMKEMFELTDTSEAENGQSNPPMYNDIAIIFDGKTENPTPMDHEESDTNESIFELIESVFPPLFGELLSPPTSAIKTQSSENSNNNNIMTENIAALLEDLATKPGGPPPYFTSSDPINFHEDLDKPWQKCLLTPMFAVDEVHSTQYRVCITAEPVEREPEGSGTRQTPTALQDIIYNLLIHGQEDEEAPEGVSKKPLWKRSADEPTLKEADQQFLLDKLEKLFNSDEDQLSSDEPELLESSN